MTVWSIMIFAYSLLLTAFSSGSETAFSSASRIRALARAREGSKKARRTVWFMKDPERYLTATLVGTNIGTVLCSSLAARFAEQTGKPWLETVTAVLVGLVILVFAEVIPKHTAFAFRDSVVDRIALPLAMLRILLYPIVFVSGYLPRLLMGRDHSSRFFESREEVRSYLHSEGEDVGRDADRALNLGSATAAEHMRPIGACTSISTDIERSDAVRVSLEGNARFLLVLEPDRRALVGMVRTALLLRQTGDWDLSRITEGLPYFERKTVLGKVLYDLKRAGAYAGVVMGLSGQPEGIIDTGLIVDAIIGEAVCRPIEPLGRLEIG